MKIIILLLMLCAISFLVLLATSGPPQTREQALAECTLRAKQTRITLEAQLTFGAKCMEDKGV